MTEPGPPFGNTESRIPDYRMPLDTIAAVLMEGNRFLLTTHKDPDVDGIGSMLALGKALANTGKDVVLLTEESVSAPLDFLRGSEKIVQGFDSGMDFDAAVLLDCCGMERLGNAGVFVDGIKPLINIDHHETNGLFGDLNLVDLSSSSTGELVSELIRSAGLPMDHTVAENIFAAIQSDTGSFRYENTTSISFRKAAEMLEYGVKPWDVSKKMTDDYSLSRLKLLEMALPSIEFYHEGRIGIMTISLAMFGKAGANQADSGSFVDFPRFVSGVEIAVLISEVDRSQYKFSLRSNSCVNVAQLAFRFGGGGHVRAAGFECHGSIEALKRDFLKQAVRFLDGTFN